MERVVILARPCGMSHRGRDRIQRAVNLLSILVFLMCTRYGTRALLVSLNTADMPGIAQAWAPLTSSLGSKEKGP